jgi:hypothetical protein
MIVPIPQIEKALSTINSFDYEYVNEKGVEFLNGLSDLLKDLLTREVVLEDSWRENSNCVKISKDDEEILKDILNNWFTKGSIMDLHLMNKESYTIHEYAMNTLKMFVQIILYREYDNMKKLEFDGLFKKANADTTTDKQNYIKSLSNNDLLNRTIGKPSGILKTFTDEIEEDILHHLLPSVTQRPSVDFFMDDLKDFTRTRKGQSSNDERTESKESFVKRNEAKIRKKNIDEWNRSIDITDNTTSETSETNAQPVYTVLHPAATYNTVPINERLMDLEIKSLRIKLQEQKTTIASLLSVISTYNQ